VHLFAEGPDSFVDPLLKKHLREEDIKGGESIRILFQSRPAIRLRHVVEFKYRIMSKATVDAAIEVRLPDRPPSKFEREKRAFYRLLPGLLTTHAG